MTNALAAAYEESAALWVEGPACVYDRLAEALVDAIPLDLTGRRVLDLGAGSGSVSRAARARGAEPVALDLAPAMLRSLGPTDWPLVAADAGRLPVRDQSLAAVLAGFLLTHSNDPAAVLADAARVTEDGGAVVATTFDRRGAEHPAKAAVDGVAEAHGWRAPSWYQHFKRTTEHRLSTPAGLMDVARQARFDGGLDAGLDAKVETRRVDTGVSSAAGIVAWRFGLAQFAPWVAGLVPADRQHLQHDACAVVGSDPEPVRLSILLLVVPVRH